MKLLMLIFLAMLSLLLTNPAKAVETIIKSTSENYMLYDLSKIPRDQPRIVRIFEWDQWTVVQTDDFFYKIDIVKGTAVQIFCASERLPLIGLSSQPGGNSYALCKDEQGFYLLARGNKSWDNLALPKTLGVAGGNVRLFSNRDHLILVDAGNIYKFAGGKWKQIPYQQHKQKGSSFSLRTLSKEDHAVLLGDEIFIGHYWGEWGGGVVSLNLNTGKWQEHFSGIPPVTGLAISPKGDLWTSQGLGHMGIFQGIIRVYDGKLWSVFSDNKNSIYFDGKQVCNNVEAKNWPFDSTEFDSLGFDGNGNLLVSSGYLGIFKYEGGRWNNWIRTGPDWIITIPEYPEHIHVSALFQPNKDTIIIGLYNGGIVILNLGTGQFNRIIMVESIYH